MIVQKTNPGRISVIEEARTRKFIEIGFVTQEARQNPTAAPQEERSSSLGRQNNTNDQCEEGRPFDQCGGDNHRGSNFARY